MQSLPKYTKILTLGSAYTQNALKGEIIIQEKVDGSQFRFGINKNKELVIGTHRTIVTCPEENKMFAKGIKYVQSIEKILKSFPVNTYFFGEYLKTSKHNILEYDRIPNNHIILFDIFSNNKWITKRQELLNYANKLNLEIVPELYKGIINLENLKKLLNTSSCLGKELVEGIVIKNYNQTILLGGKVFPLFTKYVRDKFKERHNTQWKKQSKKNSIEKFIHSFNTKARWNKALQYLKENNQLENKPRDIGKLIKRVKDDIIEEETENIKDFLFKKFSCDILRKSTYGLPEWYKNKLLENIKGE